jgi:hypothetical protein
MRLGFRNGRVVCFPKIDKQVRKIHVAQRTSDRRHNHIVYQRRHDFAEGCADDDADRHVQHIASHRKFFEFLEHARSPFSRKG